jgi:hypothetical protein
MGSKHAAQCAALIDALRTVAYGLDVHKKCVTRRERRVPIEGKFAESDGLLVKICSKI